MRSTSSSSPAPIPRSAPVSTSRSWGRGALGRSGPAPRRPGPAPAPHQADHRGRQRRRHHRRLRARAGLRLPGGQRAGPLRRHPRPGGRDARVGADGAAARGDRPAPGAGDEHHRQLRGRRARRRLGPGQPRRGPRRAAGVLPRAGARHRLQRPGRGAPDARHLPSHRAHHGRRGLADRGGRSPGSGPAPGSTRPRSRLAARPSSSAVAARSDRRTRRSCTVAPHRARSAGTIGAGHSAPVTPRSAGSGPSAASGRRRTRRSRGSRCGGGRTARS